MLSMEPASGNGGSRVNRKLTIVTRRSHNFAPSVRPSAGVLSVTHFVEHRRSAVEKEALNNDEADFLVLTARVCISKCMKTQPKLP